ncbi:MAG: ACP S-malonyltransferase [Rhizobiales bacterium]|nr:ACP S-malonyltransferase [Hyphomicrobiales bacterium]
MAPAADAVGAALENIAFARPALPVITNVSADSEDDPDKLKRALIEQVTARVRWRESVLALAGKGVTELIELGSGKVLTGLARRIDSTLEAKAIGSPRELDAHLA